MCPGEANCDDWAQPFEGTHEQKEEAICFGCPKFGSKPAANEKADDTFTEAEIEDMVADIESITDWENAGFATDWSVYPMDTKKLAVVWRNAEAEIERLHTVRFQAVLKGFLK